MKAGLVAFVLVVGALIGASGVYFPYTIDALDHAEERVEAAEAAMVEVQAQVPEARAVGWCRGYIDGMIVNGQPPPAGKTLADVETTCMDEGWGDLPPEAEKYLLGDDPKADPARPGQQRDTDEG